MGILDLFRLDGKTALVTGCRRGIGKALALGLAEAGADIIGVSRSLEPEGSEISKESLSRIPAGRWGEPADMAGAAVFLASRASDYVNGAILVVDGDWLAR